MNAFHKNCLRLPLLGLVAIMTQSNVPSAIAAEVFVPSKQGLIGKNIRGQAMTLSEANMLEPACIMIYSANVSISGTDVWYVKLRGNPVLDQPENQMAKGANSLHHYCYAELSMTRYYNARDAKEKKRHLLSAYGDYTFITSHPEYLPKNWPFLPKMYAKLADAAAKMGHDQESIRAFLKAIEIDPRYELAYTGLSDLMVTKGSKAKALEFVKEGLRHNPDSKRLMRRYHELGGKRPYPTPHPVAEGPKVKIAPSENGQTATQTAAPSHPAQNTLQEGDMPSEPLSQEPSAADSQTLGSPDNPYCRFCP